MPQQEEHHAHCESAAWEMPRQQAQREQAQQEPGLAPEAQQMAPMEPSADQEAEHEEASPKVGRRRRRRRHRRGAAAAAGNVSDDESGPSPDSASRHHSASPLNLNVVTWSDLGGDECTLRKALPLDVLVRTAPQPADVKVTVAPPVVLYGPPVQVWPVHWHCPGAAARDVHSSGVPRTGIETEAEAEWTDKDSHELRQWLCCTLGGVGVPHMSDLADLLQDLSQQAYED